MADRLRRAHWAAVGSSFAGSAMPVASPQHKESAASTVSRYLLPKPPRHSPPLLPSPGPGSHHGFSPDPQACLQVSLLSAVSVGATGTRRLTCRYLSDASRFPHAAIADGWGPARVTRAAQLALVATCGLRASPHVATRSPAGGTPRSDPAGPPLLLTRAPASSRHKAVASLGRTCSLDCGGQALRALHGCRQRGGSNGEGRRRPLFGSFGGLVH